MDPGDWTLRTKASSAGLGVSLSRHGLLVRYARNAVSRGAGRMGIRHGDVLNADTSEATVEGVSAASADPAATASNSAVTTVAGKAHRNFGDTAHSSSMNVVSVEGGRARSSGGIEDSMARNLNSVHDRTEPRTAGADAKNRSRSFRTDSGRAFNRLENLTSNPMRQSRAGGGREANACFELNAPRRAVAVAGDMVDRTQGRPSAIDVSRWAMVVGRRDSSAGREHATAATKHCKISGCKCWIRSGDDASLTTIVLRVGPDKTSRTHGDEVARHSNEAVVVTSSS